MVAWIFGGIAGLAILFALFLTHAKQLAATSHAFRDDLWRVMRTDIEKISLGSAGVDAWTAPEARSLAEQFERLGFSRIGAFAIIEIPEIEIYPLIASGQNAFATIYHIAGKAWTWFEITGRLANGKRLTVVSSPAIYNYRGRPDVIRHDLLRSNPTQALTVYLREAHRSGSPLETLCSSAFEDDFVGQFRVALQSTTST